MPHAQLAALLLGLLGLTSGLVQAEDDFLPPKQAFKPTVEVAQGHVVVRYEVASGYYLYRDRLGFESTTPRVALGSPSYPVGEDHEDDFFGKQVVYRGTAVVGVPLEFDGPPRDFDLTLKLQGCADAGLCYPPQAWPVRVVVPGATAAAPSTASPSAAPVAAAAGGVEPARPGFSLKRLFGGGPRSESDFLPIDEAFVLSVASDSADRVTVRFDIADDYYLYRDKTRVAAPGGAAQLGEPRIPGGEIEHDEYFGEQVVFRGQMIADIPVAAAPGTREVPLEISFQGCADAGLCYPPTTKQVTVTLASTVSAAPASTPAASAAPPAAPRQSEQDALAERIRSGNLLAVLATFFGAGLLLAFTPCVLPMVPILSGIIVGAGGEKPVSRGRAFSLSLAYVMGMALTYTIAGAAFAAAGQQAQAFFQKPWIIVLFAGLFVLLALGMFGAFTLQVPAAFQARVADLSNKQRQGTLAGTAVMGALSSLIVTACVAPPLVAALAVIGQSGDVVRGAAALFALSIGMGAPLLLVGASAGRLLPRAGAWMDAVKAVFGVMLLGVAIWMLGRILPGPITLALWAALAFVSGYALLAAGGRETRSGADLVRRGLGALAMVYGVLLLIGALSGRSDPLQPLAGLGATGGAASATEHVAFKRIKTVADLEREIAAASAAGRPVMLDFYADWCVSCKEMERYTFTDPGVQAEFERAVLLQADVTANDAEDQALLQRFGILGPPTILFFDAGGRELDEFRVVGFKPAAEFRAHLAAAFGGTTA
ncbi:MAG: protein-disulfide reductase DsbD [Steroidobacteraceae bacterium]